MINANRNVCPECTGSGVVRTTPITSHTSLETTICTLCGGTGILEVLDAPRSHHSRGARSEAAFPDSRLRMLTSNEEELRGAGVHKTTFGKEKGRKYGGH